MKHHNMQHFASESDKTAAVVERFNRRIKTRIWTYLLDRGIVWWVDVIKKLVNAYNHLYHRSLDMAPADVNKRHDDTLLTRLYGDWDMHLKPAMPRNSMVNISTNTGVFNKGYMLNWS